MEYSSVLSYLVLCRLISSIVPWQLDSRPNHWEISYNRPESHQRKKMETLCLGSKRAILSLDYVPLLEGRDLEGTLTLGLRRFPPTHPLLLMVNVRPNS